MSKADICNVVPLAPGELLDVAELVLAFDRMIDLDSFRFTVAKGGAR